MLRPFIQTRRKLVAKMMQNASQDRRFKILETHMKRHQYRSDGLIEVLHKAQDLFGCLGEDVLSFVAHQLKVPTSRVYGVATFYHFFTLKPAGRHVCVVCLGTACYVKGADRVLTALQDFTRLKPGETSPDQAVSLLTARCLGTCSMAPVVVFDSGITGCQTPEIALQTVKGWFSDGSE